MRYPPLCGSLEEAAAEVRVVGVDAIVAPGSAPRPSANAARSMIA
jgi:hypothetical protein